MDPRYPIGKFALPGEVTSERRQEAIDEIGFTPAKLRAAVKGLDESQLNTPYRDGRVDGEAGCPPRSGQPYECAGAAKTRAHRGQTDNQALRRNGVGGAGGFEVSAN